MRGAFHVAKIFREWEWNMWILLKISRTRGWPRKVLHFAGTEITIPFAQNFHLYCKLVSVITMHCELKIVLHSQFWQNSINYSCCWNKVKIIFTTQQNFNFLVTSTMWERSGSATPILWASCAITWGVWFTNEIARLET